jgi:leader peptidase (prepilin peptidase)/N-methyltransferase
MLELLQSSPAMWITTALLFGLVIGSFLNVVILRLPRRLEFDWRQQCQEMEDPQGSLELEAPPGLVMTRSHCPHCGHGITAMENIPVFSYLALRGRCSACGEGISIQYPLVEATTAVLSALVAAKFGFTITAGTILVLTWTLIALTVIDLREQLLPDVLTLPLMWLGLLLNTGNLFVSPSESIIGAAVGYLSLWSIYHLFRLLTGKEGMGYGDFKLLAVFGAWLGWQMIPLVILLSSFVGAVVGVTLVVFRGRDHGQPMAFGPYLAMAGWIAMLWGEDILRAYLGG